MAANVLGAKHNCVDRMRDETDYFFNEMLDMNR